MKTKKPTIKELAKLYCKEINDKWGWDTTSMYILEIKLFARWADKKLKEK